LAFGFFLFADLSLLFVFSFFTLFLCIFLSSFGAFIGTIMLFVLVFFFLRLGHSSAQLFCLF